MIGGLLWGNLIHRSYFPFSLSYFTFPYLLKPMEFHPASTGSSRFHRPHLTPKMASSCELKRFASIQDDLESEVDWNWTKTFSLKENLQNCSTDHAAAQECKKQLTSSHSAVVTDGTAKAEQC